MQKEQLKRKARAMGYTTMAFDTALAAARARHAIMDGKGLARLSSHGCHLAAATTVPGPFQAEALVANRRFWSGQLQMQGATSEAAAATVAAMMDGELASLVKNAQTAILQKATLGLTGRSRISPHLHASPRISPIPPSRRVDPPLL